MGNAVPLARMRGADFLAWQRNVSAPAVRAVAPPADADFNDDGYADGAAKQKPMPYPPASSANIKALFGALGEGTIGGKPA